MSSRKSSDEQAEAREVTLKGFPINNMIKVVAGGDVQNCEPRIQGGLGGEVGIVLQELHFKRSAVLLALLYCIGGHCRRPCAGSASVG